jgi:phosphohistidine phosphatase
LHEVPRRFRHVLVIGHNPGLQALALDLIGDGAREQIAALGRKMPTGGLAVISFEASAWRGIVAGTGHLEAFTTPAALAEAG